MNLARKGLLNQDVASVDQSLQPEKRGFPMTEKFPMLRYLRGLDLVFTGTAPYIHVWILHYIVLIVITQLKVFNYSKL